MLEAISCHKFDRQRAIRDLLVVLVPSLLVVELFMRVYFSIKQLFGCPPENILQIAVRGTAIKGPYRKASSVLGNAEEILK